MNDNMMEKEPEYNKIAKYLAGESTPEEISEIRNRMKEDPEYAELVRNFRKVWNTKKVRIRNWDIEGVWENLSREMEKEKENRSLRPRREKEQPGRATVYSLSRGRGMQWVIRIAAMLMVAGLTSLFTIQYITTSGEEDISMKEVVTDGGQRATLQLEDGSRIRLNSESRLQHPAAFDAEERAVHLSGEAYFEIARDGRPFFVYADGARIEVLGTEFNVQAYDDEESIEVVVAGGKVAVQSDAGPGSGGAELERGEMALINRNDAGMVSVSGNVDLQKHLGWMDYRLSFDDTPMDRVARKLERWYGVEIEFAEAETETLNLSATFEDESIHEVLRVIDIALGLDHRIEGRNITLYRTDRP